MNGYVWRLESVCDYEAGEPGNIWDTTPIHVNIIININIILHHCALTDSNKKRRGVYSTGKREKGGES
jgi:hypothetical protein